MRTASLTLGLLFVFVGALFAPDAGAQKNSGKYREFPAHGFKFKPLDKMSDVPINENLASVGIIGQFEAGLEISVKFNDNERRPYTPSLKVLKIVPEGPTTGEDAKRGERTDTRTTGLDFVKSLFGRGIRSKDPESKLSEVKGAKKLVIQRDELVGPLELNYNTGSADLDVVFDVYMMQLSSAKIVFVWDYPADKKVRKKWSSAVLKSMKSFALLKGGEVESGVGEVNSDSSYEDLIKFHENDVAQTPGWHLVETKSKRYLIKTNSDHKGNIKDVINRLEASRNLYEKDFPPSAPIKSVSVVRLCDSRADFNQYGQTGGGVAGYFNPRSEELVLFFGGGGKGETLAVMAHEGFHQYCHFLFGRAEAHRWFDEGHGDYYGAWKMKGKKMIPNDDMVGGLSRVPEIKQMFRENDIKPLSEHIRYNHPEWQNQGPRNVSCYAQSFALVYFLREGARRKIPNKYWQKEYAEIIPNYMTSLNAGFKELYDAIRAEAKEVLDELEAEDDPDPDRLDQARRRYDTPWNFLRGGKEDVWEKAMADSWGNVDEAEFEKRWLSWIDNSL